MAGIATIPTNLGTGKGNHLKIPVSWRPPARTHAVPGAGGGAVDLVVVGRRGAPSSPPLLSPATVLLYYWRQWGAETGEREVGQLLLVYIAALFFFFLFFLFPLHGLHNADERRMHMHHHSQVW